MSRKAFHELLDRYLSGNCTLGEKEIVDRWYDMLDADHESKNVGAEELEYKLWKKISETTLIDQQKLQYKKRIVYLKRYIAVAAAVTLVVCGAIWVHWRLNCYPIKPNFISSNSTEIVDIFNDSEETKIIYLPDSSRIELYKSSRITYPIRFKKNMREVKLEGDALFSVQANPENPFYVFHENIITKVLGTKFLITCGNEKNQEEVIVYSGRVKVIKSGNKSSFIERLIEKPTVVNLTINQRAILNEENNVLRETLVEQPLPIETKRFLLNDVNFNDVNLDILVAKLSEIYGLEIRVAESKKEITFTGDLSNMELFDQLDMICKVSQTSYHVKDKTVIIR